jgi:ketosteroid isomerase-like protein
MASPGVSQVDEAAVMQVLGDYYRAFSSLDLQKILPFIHEPALLMAPQGVVAAPTRTEVAAVIAPTLEGLRAKGYARSELTRTRLTMLGSASALIIGVAERYKADGQPLESAGVTYLLQRTGAGWKIAVMILDDTGGAGPRN